MTPISRKQGGERGFALLMVFVLAAVIAITLYTEMPRVAFESQRAKEQLLVDRGNEYKRAIQLYYRKLKRFPSKIDDLESTSNFRFLRRRFTDPMTGKDDWRLVHVGPGGFLTDSLVQKPNPLGGKDQKDQTADASQNPTGQPAQPLNANGTEGGGGINLATARRPSDTMVTGAPPGGGSPAGLPPADGSQNPQQPFPSQYAGQPGQPAYPGQPVNPGQPGQPPYPVQPPFPGQPPSFPGANGQPVLPGQQGFPTQFVQPGQAIQGQPGQPGQPLYPIQPGQVNPPQPGQPGFPPFPPTQLSGQQVYPQPTNSFQQGQPYSNQPQFPTAPPVNAGPGANAAIDAIKNSLFSARQPPSGLSGTPDNLQGGGIGIAGVATKYKGEGIKRVNEKSKYQEWEFVYDLKKDKTVVGNQVGQPQQPQNPVSPGFGPSAPTPPVPPTPRTPTPQQ